MFVNWPWNAIVVIFSRLLKTTHMLRCRSIASLQRTVSMPPLVDFSRASLWNFLSSLKEDFFRYPDSP